MNLTFLANNGSFSIQSISNSSIIPRNRQNETSDAEVFKFTSLAYSAHYIIFLLSLFGNSVIIHIIRTDNSMKTTTNYLILNQACADILTTLMGLINTLGQFSPIGKRWFGGLFGLISCKSFLAIIFTLPLFSIWILVTIAVERFYAVTRPLRPSPVSQHFKKTILLLWVLSFAFSTNVILKGILVKFKDYFYCYIETAGWITFNGIFGTVNIFVPLLIITILYTIVCYKLWSREVPGEGNRQSQMQAEALKTARKVTQMMIVVVALYVLCWLPLFLSFILYVVGHMQLLYNLRALLPFLTVAYGALNPYIYLTFSQIFRSKFIALFGNCLLKIKIHNVQFARSQSIELQQM
ncbi:neuromedin-K receptor-like isoform X1 [Oculina patagonica]